MNNETLLIIIAIIGGIAVSLQGQFMGQVDRQIGTAESVFITYGVGALLVGLVMIYLKGGSLGSLISAKLPWYVYTSGILGIIIVGSISFSVPRLGMAKAFTLILLGQFFVAAIVDHFGFFGADVHQIDLKKMAGLVILLIGAVMVVS